MPSAALACCRSSARRPTTRESHARTSTSDAAHAHAQWQRTDYRDRYMYCMSAVKPRVNEPVLTACAGGDAVPRAPRCPSCRTPIKAAHHSRTLQRAVTSACDAPAGGTGTNAAAGPGANNTSQLRQRRGVSSAAAATRLAAEPSRDDSRELATALYRIQRHSVDRCAILIPPHSSPHTNRMGPRVDSGLLSRSWVFHARTMCCIDIRALTALVCAVTIVINLLLWRMQTRKDLHAQQQLDSTVVVTGVTEHAAVAGLALSADTASNCFSVFAYCVGLLAVCAQSGELSSAFFHYALADTLFAVLPKTVEAVALALHPGTLLASGAAGASSRRLIGCLLTLVVNLLYNLPCLAVAVAFNECFELRLSDTTVGDDALDDTPEDSTAPTAQVAHQ